MKKTCMALLIMVASVSSVSAQQEQERGGFWVGLGMGAGSVDVGCPGCDDEDREVGASGYLRLGATLSPNFLLGIESTGWVKNEDAIDQSFGALTVVGVFYPSQTGGFFLKAGLGFARLEADDFFDELSATGFAVNLGFGYDFRVGRTISLTPYVNALGMAETDLEFDGFDVGEKVDANLFQFGLGITFH